MQAVILAGGLGTRLFPLTQTRAKPLLPLAGAPMLHRIVRYLEKSGFDTVIVAVGNHSRQVRQSLRDVRSVDVIFSEESFPLGTAGSVKNASKYLSDAFVVIQGDNVTDMSLAAARSFHASRGGIATLLLKEKEDATGLGVVDLKWGSQVSRFVEKPHFSVRRSSLVNTGVYLLEPEILDQIPRGVPFDFGNDLFPKLLDKGFLVNGLPMGGYWIDVGTPSAYKEACRWFLTSMTEGVPAEVPGVQPGRTMLVGRDSFIQNGLDSWTVIGPSMVRAGCQIEGRAVIDGCILERGVSVGPGAILRDSVILEDSKIEAGAVVESAIVGEGCRLGENSRVEGGTVIGGYVETGSAVRLGPGSVVPARSLLGTESAPLHPFRMDSWAAGDEAVINST